MKIRWIIIIVLVLALTLNACSPGAPTETDEPVPQPSPTQEQAYPSPDPTQLPEVMYPDINDGDEVPWVRAVSMILNGEVTQVTQLHSQQVIIALKDGRAVTSMQPEMDAVFKIIEQCGEKCGDIVVATE